MLRIIIIIIIIIAFVVRLTTLKKVRPYSIDNWMIANNDFEYCNTDDAKLYLLAISAVSLQ